MDQRWSELKIKREINHGSEAE